MSLVDSTGERIMIDFYVQREVLKAHTDCPAVSCHEGPALLLAAAEDRDACFVRFVRPSASLVKGVNGSKVIWFPAPTAAARFAFAHRRLPPYHVDPRVRGPGMLLGRRSGIPHPPDTPAARLKEPKSKATCVRPRVR
jgi:hypothetical protein